MQMGSLGPSEPSGASVVKAVDQAEGFELLSPAAGSGESWTKPLEMGNT